MVPNDIELNIEWMELILVPNGIEFPLVFRNTLKCEQKYLVNNYI